MRYELRGLVLRETIARLMSDGRSRHFLEVLDELRWQAYVIRGSDPARTVYYQLDKVRGIVRLWDQDRRYQRGLYQLPQV